MKFKLWLERKHDTKAIVLAHIAGPSGSGKTTLALEMKKKYHNINFKDLDDFDDEGEKLLGYTNIDKKDYTDKMLLKLAKKRQQLMDEYISNSNKPIVFVGHHTENSHVLNISTKNKFRLDVNAKTAAKRGYERSQKENQKYRRLKSELPKDEKEAQDTIDELNELGYQPVSVQYIINFIENISNKLTKK